MLEAMGITFVFFACIFFSFKKVSDQKQRLTNLKQIKKALLFMKNEISFSAKELSQLVASLKGVLSEDMGVFFQNVAQVLTEHGTADFGQAWEEAKKKWGEKPFLPITSDRIMTAFSQQVGKMPREAELAHLDKTLEAIDSALADADVNYEKNRKLIYTLGVCVGTAIFILLI